MAELLKGNKNTRVLLINPSQEGVYGKMGNPDYPPLGLSYIGAVIERDGYPVNIIDMSAADIALEKLADIGKSYDVIGITATTPTFKSANQVAGMIKKHTKAITVLGGIHATIAPEECMQSENIDFLVKGEGEETVLELLKALKSNKKDYQNIKGISYKENGSIIHNEKRALIKDLDALPLPARHLFNHRKYAYPDSLLSPVMPIISSRGCPHGCTYCCTKLIFSRRVRLRSAINIVDEIEFLLKNYKVKEVHFWDDNFTSKKQRVLEVYEELRSRKIKLKFAFPNGLRVDQVDEDILTWMKKMGVYSVAFGVESGNQIVLDNVKKGTKLDQIRKAYKLAKRLGLETWGFFMLGLPGEDRKTIYDTIQFAKEIDPDVAKFHILKPYPGTEVFEQLKDSGMITDFDFSQYGIHTRPVHRLSKLSEDDLLELSKIAYRQFYFRPAKIIRHVLRMKSFERFKVNMKTAFALIKSVR